MESFFADKHNEAILKKINLASFAININFDDYNSYCRRSTLYESLGLFKLALDDAVKAISIDNQRDEGYLIQAKAFTGLKKFTEAEKSLNECLSRANCNQELVLNQLENLRYLGVKQIGFGDQICLLASRKFSSLNEAINGAFSMDLDDLETNDNTIVENNPVTYNNNDCHMQQMSYSDNQSLISSQSNLMQIAEENPSSTLVENNVVNENEANNECFSSDARWESESTVASKKPALPQFTPVKDLISDIENDYFCNDFTSSPFTRNSNSSISFAETLTTPQLNKKDSSEIDQQVSKKPKVIKNLMKDLTENSENSPNQIESSSYSSPSKCFVSSPLSNIFSSPKSNFYSSPKPIQSPFKIVNTNNDSNINNNISNMKTIQVINNVITNDKSHQVTENQNKPNKVNSKKVVSPSLNPTPKVKPISTVQCPTTNDKLQITIVDFNKKKNDSEKSHQEISINKLINDNALANNHSLIKVNNSISNKQTPLNEISIINSQGKKIGTFKGDFENLTAENISKLTESFKNGRLANFQTNEKVTSKLLVQRRLISEKMILDTKMCKIKINENKKRPLNNS